MAKILNTQSPITRLFEELGKEKPDKNFILELIEIIPKSQINTTNDRNNTLLILSTKKGYYEIVQALLDHHSQKIDVNIKNSSGYSALILAAKNGHNKIVEILLNQPSGNNEVNINITTNHNGIALHWASWIGHLDILELLLSHSDININHQDNDGYTVLILAAYRGNYEIVNMLLNHPLTKDEIDVNMVDIHNNTALYWASRVGQDKNVELLLNHTSIDINIKNNLGQTALSIACNKLDKLNSSDVDEYYTKNSKKSYNKIINLLENHYK